MYGPQKGLRQAEFPFAERCLRQLARVVRNALRHDLAREPGAGAAGGLGFGLRAFLGACFEPGFDLFARLARLEQRLCAADLVITGEGAIDRSTLMGKGVGQLALRCRDRGVPCVALAGSVSPSARARGPFAQVHSLVQLTSLAQAKAKPGFWLERLAAKVASVVEAR